MDTRARLKIRGEGWREKYIWEKGIFNYPFRRGGRFYTREFQLLKRKEEITGILAKKRKKQKS